MYVLFILYYNVIVLLLFVTVTLMHLCVICIVGIFLMYYYLILFVIDIVMYC